MTLQATQQSVQPSVGQSAPTFQIGGSNLDAFGRMRVSDNKTLFSYVSKYELNTALMDTITATGGSVSYDSNTNHINLSCTNGSGSKAVLQSHLYLRYQPGKSGYIKGTNNFLEADLTGNNVEFAVVQRSSTSGSVVDTRATLVDNESDDVFNGSLALSGFGYNLNKGNLFFIDFAYLGVGPVRFSIISDEGEIILVHKFKNPSLNDEMYMQTATLPFRCEVYNDGSNTYKRMGYFDDNNGLFWELKYPGSTAESMNFFCCAIESEGGTGEEAELGNINDAEVNSVTVSSTLIPILSIRPKATYQSKTNRATVVAAAIDAFVESSKPAKLALYLNATITGGTAPVWTSVASNSVVEYDTTADTISGGQRIRTVYMAGSSQINLTTDLLEEINLALDAAGTVADTLTIAAVRVGASDTSVSASMSFKELL